MANQRFDTAPQFNVGTDSFVVQQSAGASAPILDLKDSSGNSVMTVSSEGTTTATLAPEIGLPAGMMAPFAGHTAPSGWLLCDGKEYAIATYTALYNVLTNSGSVFPYGANTNGSGSAGSTHFRTPDMRGRVPAGVDNMGGSAANRLTSTVLSASNTIGATGGTQTHTLTEAQMPSHTHIQNSHNHDQYSHNHGVNIAGTNVTWNSGAGGNTRVNLAGSYGSYADTYVLQNVATTASNYPQTATNQNTGGGNAHPIAQPTMVVNYIVKY